MEDPNLVVGQDSAHHSYGINPSGLGTSENQQPFDLQYNHEMDLLKQKKATLVDTKKRRKE